jgi:hypothetical protein
MIGKIRSRLTSAHLIGVVALVFAVAGGVALANVPNNSVGTKKIKNGAVTTKKIKNGAVTRAKIRNNAVNSAKVANNSLTGADINESTLVGVQGPQGPPGPAGGGVSGASNLFFNAVAGTGNIVLYNANGLTIRASCSGGTVLTATAEASTDNSEIRTQNVRSGNEAGDTDFDSSDTISLIPGLIDDNYVLAYRQGGAGGSLTGEYYASDTNPHDRCQLYGHLFFG